MIGEASTPHAPDAVPGPTNRSFGLTVGGILVGIIAIRALWVGTLGPISWTVLAIGATLVILAVVAPATLTGANRGWMALGLFLNRVVSPVVMGLVFFLVVVPTALVMRWRGHDPLGLRSSRATSYWRSRDDDRAGGRPTSMQQQF